MKPFVTSFSNMFFNPAYWATPRNAATITRSQIQQMQAATSFTMPRVPRNGGRAAVANYRDVESILRGNIRRRN